VDYVAGKTDNVAKIVELVVVASAAIAVLSAYNGAVYRLCFDE